MSIETDLSVSPYFDDYDADYNYYRTLFKPSTAVQVRELNQLQTVLQEQIARFGDHILKRGTILEGCEAQFLTEIPYIKINDLTAEFRASVDPEGYEGLLLRNSSGLTSEVINSRLGFEAQDPNLNTLYLDYKDADSSGNSAAYSPGSQLEVYAPDLRLYGFEVVNPAQGFSNTDTVVITECFEVQNTAGGIEFAGGTFVAGKTLTMDDNSATATIVSVNTTANSDAIVLVVEPLATNLTPTPNTSSWVYNVDSSFSVEGSVGVGTPIEAIVVGRVGEGASARIQTTSAGAIDSISILTQGEDFYVPPTVKIASTSATTTQSNTLDITARPYLAAITVSSLSDSVGVAFGMEITEGYIYQKGYFLQVEEQSIIVEPYSNTPDEIAVGFDTAEFIVNSGIDSTLYDNAQGFLNLNAPGADRLKLVPTLAVKSTDEAEEDSEFLPIWKFSEGKPYYQAKTTQYSAINDELSKRTFDIAGDFVLDPFEITTRSTLEFDETAENFSYVIDPGYGYINGRRVETERQYATDMPKGTDTAIDVTTVDASYGNFIRVDQLGGIFASDRLQLIKLYDAPLNYLDDLNGDLDAFVTGVSEADQVGTARIRSFILESGVMGSDDAVYRLYIYDVRMNNGKNFFRDVKSVVADETSDMDGVADVVLDGKISTAVDPEDAANPTSNLGAVIYEPDQNFMIFAQDRPLKSVTNISYKYKNLERNATITTGGVVTAGLEPGSTWPFVGDAEISDLVEIIVVPEGDLVDTGTYTGTISSSGTTVTGSGTAFSTELDPGDYILAAGQWRRVQSISNDTTLQLNVAPAPALSGASFSKGYPANVAVPLITDPNITAAINGVNLEVTFSGLTLASAGLVSVISSQQRTNETPTTKAVTRGAMSRVRTTSTINGGVIGPWSLGFNDVIRLRKVYQGTAALPPDDSGNYEDVTNFFYVERNENSNQQRHAQLVLRSNAAENGYTVPADAEWLVVYDCLTMPTGGVGVKVINSYALDDTLELDALTTANSHIHTHELPEFFDNYDEYFDVRECIDFRPTVASQYSLATTSATAVCIQTLPTNDGTLYGGADFRIPVPDSDISCTMEYYLPRKDVILLNADGEFEVIADGDIPRESPNQLYLYEAEVPPYPTVPERETPEMNKMIDTDVFSTKEKHVRPEAFQIDTQAIEEQVEGYTMDEIAQLERRIEVLEYYTLLSETENDVKEKSMPSSVDDKIQRYKFGFFVDNFEDYTHTNTDDSSHTASIYDFKLSPAKTTFDIELQPTQESQDKFTNGYSTRFPYTKKKLLSQSNVTDGPVIPPRPSSSNTTIIVYNDPPVPKVTRVQYYVPNRNSKSDGRNGSVYEENTFVMSDLADADGKQVQIFFDVFGGKDRIEIYQGSSSRNATTLLCTHEAATIASGYNVTNLTQAERRALNNKKYAEPHPTFKRNTNRWTRQPRNFVTSSGPGGSSYWIQNQGKLVFNYDASKGRYIKIRVVKGSPHHQYVINIPGTTYSYASSRTVTPPRKPVVIRVPTPPVRPTKPFTPYVDPTIIAQINARQARLRAAIAARAAARIPKIILPVKVKKPVCVIVPPPRPPVKVCPPRPVRICIPPPPPPKKTHDDGITRVTVPKKPKVPWTPSERVKAIIPRITPIRRVTPGVVIKPSKPRVVIRPAPIIRLPKPVSPTYRRGARLGFGHVPSIKRPSRKITAPINVGRVTYKKPSLPKRPPVKTTPKLATAVMRSIARPKVTPFRSPKGGGGFSRHALARTSFRLNRF